MPSFSITRETIYNCSLERAFKSPMLCDVSKVHTGKGIMPAVTHTTDDAKWGQPGSSKRVFSSKSISFKGGESAIDRVIERVENDYWIIEVSEFKTWMLGFYKFVGTWKVKEIEINKIHITYTYDLYSKAPLLYLFNWLFVKLFWGKYMVQVLENIRVMAEGNEPFLYD